SAATAILAFVTDGDRGSDAPGSQRPTPTAPESVAPRADASVAPEQTSASPKLAPTDSVEGASMAPTGTDPIRTQAPRTLEQRLGTDDFARRGWQRLIELTDYVAHLVDGRTTGVLATESRAVYLRVLSLATTLKA